MGQVGITYARGHVYLSYRDDPAQNRQLRVYPGQEIVVPGYRLRILAVEPGTVRVAVLRQT